MKWAAHQGRLPGGARGWYRLEPAFRIADLAARRNQPDATRLAMRLMPVNGAYPAQLADEIYASDPVRRNRCSRGR